MDSKQEHLKNLSEIRSLMERSSSFISLSGLSGVSAGIVGLITAAVMQLNMGEFMNYEKTPLISLEKRNEILLFGILLSAAALVVTFALAIFFTARKAKKSNVPVWDGSARRLVQSLFIPLVAGGIFCLLLVMHRFDWLVLPSMLIFYGLALLNAGKYTLHEITWLGISEIVLGLLAVYFLSWSIYFWGLGFGILNIIYGMVMYFKYEKSNAGE
jgi:hypothetical protein